MRKFSLLLLTVSLGVLGFISPAQASNDDPPAAATASTLTLAAPPLWAGENLPFVATLTEGDEPASGKEVVFSLDGATTVATTDGAGQAAFTHKVNAAATFSLGVSFAGDADLEPSQVAPASFTTVLQDVALTTSVASKAVDGKRQTIKVSGATVLGKPATGKVVIAVDQGSVGVKRYTKTLAGGKAEISVPLFRDSEVRVTSAATAIYKAGASAVKAVSLEIGAPKVSLSGPKPKILAPQKRSTSEGANVRISKIPDAVWKSMQGKSWRKGCIARSKLRFIKVNYWGFDGYRHEGQLIVAASRQKDFKRALEGMYAKKLPVRYMYLVDRFGYSSKVRGADDYASMKADNTSAFNCRGVVGNASVRSPHSTGKAFDINPWENPYHSKKGWTPNTYWKNKSHPRVAWRSSSHPMVKVMKKAGFKWTYGKGDSQHFDA